MSRRTACRQRFYAQQRERREWSQVLAVYAAHYDDDEAFDERTGEYLGNAVTCWGCGGEGTVVFCFDDICQGQGYCMHGDGDELCRDCGGEGVL